MYLVWICYFVTIVIIFWHFVSVYVESVKVARHISDVVITSCVFGIMLLLAPVVLVWMLPTLFGPRSS